MEELYDIQRAETSYNATRRTLENDIKALGAECATINASKSGLQRELEKSVSANSKARLEAYLQKQSEKLRETELQLDIKRKKFDTMSISDFMGDAPKEIDSTLQRRNMTDAQKAQIVRERGMSEYLKIQY